jgi:anti-anti-sigma factor
MEIGERTEGGVVVLRPFGRIDNDTSPEFHAKLIACIEAGRAALVNFDAVEFISSAGLAALMAAAKLAKAKNVRIAVASLRPVAQEIFAISRFSRVVQTYVTVAEGIAAMQLMP